MVRLKAGGVCMTASVPLDQATDIIQNWITEMCKQKAETENNNASPHPPIYKFPSCYDENLELPHSS